MKNIFPPFVRTKKICGVCHRLISSHSIFLFYFSISFTFLQINGYACDRLHSLAASIHTYTSNFKLICDILCFPSLLLSPSSISLIINGTKKQYHTFRVFDYDSFSKLLCSAMCNVTQKMRRRYSQIFCRLSCAFHFL